VGLILLMGRGLFYCHIYASQRTPLGTGGVDLSIPVEQGGVVAHASKVLVSASMVSIVLMSLGFPHRTMSSVG
jgi:hypothetical protein